jgi:3-hydroxyacyl-CoA dehydrogenase
MDAGEFAAFRAAVERKFRGQTAPRLAADAVAASTLPFDEGLERERVLFEETLHGPQSKALIHVFFAEREVAKIPDIPKETPLLPVMRAAVVGCGTMGMGIVLNFASAGIPVLVKEDTPHALERGLAGIRALYDAQVVKGRLSREDADKRFSLITPTLTWDWFASADIVVEAVYESLALKKHIFADLDKVAKPGAILATNTSTLDVDDIAAATSRAAYVCGMHFFSPANVMKLVEVIRGKYTNPSVVATVMDLARRLRKTAVLSGNCFGFIGNRMFEPYRREAVRCVEEGASPSQVDKALTDWGMAMGPIAVADLVGLDTLWLIHRAYEAPGSFEDTLYQRGRYGQKSNAGWYLYDEKRRAIPDPAVDSMLREYAAVQGIPQRTFTDEEVVDRCLSALAREGRDILDEKIALRASDIDVVYVHGYGFPAWRGGPMFHAGLR